MGNLLCMGLFLIFSRCPSPRCDVADDGLAALMDVDMLDCDALLPFAAMVVQSFHQHRIRADELIGLAQILSAPLETLI